MHVRRNKTYKKRKTLKKKSLRRKTRNRKQRKNYKRGGAIQGFNNIPSDNFNNDELEMRERKDNLVDTLENIINTIQDRRQENADLTLNTVIAEIEEFRNEAIEIDEFFTNNNNFNNNISMQELLTQTINNVIEAFNIPINNNASTIVGNANKYPNSNNNNNWEL